MTGTRDSNLSNGFKETEIGPIPVEWEVVRLGELIHFRHLMVRNGFPCGDHNQQGRGIPHLRPFNVTTEGQVELETIKYIETSKDVKSYLLKPGDIIFNNTNSEELVGKTAYWDRVGDFVLSNHMTILRVLDLEVLDPFYLSRFLHKRWYDGYYRSICRRHVNQASVSLARLGDIPVPLPPLPEQRRIAHVLSTIQRTIAAQDALIAAAREVKRSLMQRLFTYGPGPEPAPTKETEIGEMPEHWEVKQLQEAAEIVYGVQAAVASNLDPSIGIPILTNVNISVDGMLDFTKMRYYNLPDKKREKLVLQRGDVLFNWRSGSVRHVGKTAFFDLPGEYTFSSFLLRIRAHPEINNHFLFYYLTWLRAVGYFVRRCLFLVNAKFNASEAARTPTASPPLEEQKEIACALTNADRKIAAEEQRRAALQELFKATLHQLMSGQIRVRDMEFQK